MSEREGMSEWEGMGRPSGPAFTVPPLAGSSVPGAHPPDSHPPGSRSPDSQPAHPHPVIEAPPTGRPAVGPPPNRLPTVLTVVAIALVATIVAVASALGARDDVRRATPRPAPPVAVSSPVAVDRIEFSTSSGTGVLEIIDHSWNSDGSDVHAPGSLLTVAVRVSCDSGTLRYGPDSFAAFDRDGDLFDPEVLPDSATALEIGTLSAGQHVDGTVAFDIPRGGVTLLLSDESSRTVTALKVPD